jgi:NAD(P)-dependent dehydrogenase (short-subunit alcohol dehydrogenase family)
MKARGSGSIVLFSSMYGVIAPDPRMYLPPMTPNPIDYGASKAGILQMTRYLATHYGPAGVRVNAITPGPFPNPGLQQREPEFIKSLSQKTALRRIGINHEIVGPALFLLGDQSSFVTGHSLAVDGGWTVV